MPLLTPFLRLLDDGKTLSALPTIACRPSWGFTPGFGLWGLQLKLLNNSGEVPLHLAGEVFMAETLEVSPHCRFGRHFVPTRAEDDQPKGFLWMSLPEVSRTSTRIGGKSGDGLVEAGVTAAKQWAQAQFHYATRMLVAAQSVNKLQDEFGSIVEVRV